LSICDADNLADHQSYLTSTHTNCLIQLLKSVSIKPFALTEAAHSTAALCLVKLFLKNFSFPLNRLRSRSTCVSRQREANHTASKTAVNHLFQPLPINLTEATNSAQPPPCQPGAFYSNLPSVQVLILANLLIYKRFNQRPAPEKVRIIGTQNITSTVVFSFFNQRAALALPRLASFLSMNGSRTNSNAAAIVA